MSRYRWGPAIWLTLALTLPGTLFYFGLASSLSLGTALACFLFLARASVRLHQADTQAWLSTSAMVAGLVVCGVVAHLLFAATFLPIDLGRALASLIPLSLLIGGGAALADRLFRADSVMLDTTIARLVVAFTLIGYASCLGITLPSAVPSLKPLFPFTEPSHFALVYVPLLLHTAVRSTHRVRLLWLAAALGLALWLQSLTLMLGVGLVALATLRPTWLAVALGAAAAATSSLDLSYFTERLPLHDDNENLSYLVLIQGWQLMDDALQRSGGWGIGFQQLGLTWNDVPTADLILRLANDYLNLLDGGSTAAKLISEFGVAAIVMLALHAVLAFKLLWALRRLARTPARSVVVPAVQRLSMAVWFALLIELWVRGVGYFSPTMLLAAATGCFWLQHRWSRTPRAPRPMVGVA